MGILNVTPDSFSDGGRYVALDDAVAFAQSMVAAGADFIDIGGESTRPGAEPVDADEEIARVVPVIEALVDAEPTTIISIDTTKALVADAALTAGAAMINDVSAFTFDPAIADVAADSGAPCVLMHLQGSPRTMQDAPRYDDVVEDIRRWLDIRADAAIARGVAADRIAVDPGIGFGKTVAHNYEILRRLDELLGDLPDSRRHEPQESDRRAAR